MNLIDKNGRVQFGIHAEPVTGIDHTRYTLKDPLGRVVEAAERDAQFKRFHFMGFVSASLVVGCAMTDTAQLRSAFVYVFDKASGTMIKRGFRAREGDVFAIAAAPDEGVSRLAVDGADITMTAVAATRSKRLEIVIGDDIKIDMSFCEADGSEVGAGGNRGAGFDTLRICTPTGPTGWTYAQKVAGIPATGRIETEFGAVDLAADHACAHHDYTAGFLRRETFWNWACISDVAAGGTVGAGERVGANLSNGVNETGFTENAYWRDGQRIKVDSMMFDYDDEDLNKPWHITSHDGSVDLTFTPHGGYNAFSDRPGAETRFDQLFGTYSGRLGTGDKALDIRDLWGFAERQYVVW